MLMLAAGPRGRLQHMLPKQTTKYNESNNLFYGEGDGAGPREKGGHGDRGE